jgi:hypothetical protein
MDFNLKGTSVVPEFPGQPKTKKGAIVLLRPNSKAVAQVFVFQYNPNILTRMISPPNTEVVSMQEGKNQDTDSFVELINLNLEFDVADQLEHPNQRKDFVQRGLHPTLAALESIMHSQSKTEDQTSPVVLFLWGANRTIPVWIENLKITEEAFDPNLNPSRLRIELNMRVRKLSEFKEGSQGYAIFSRYLNQKLIFAQLYSKNEINRNFLKQFSQNIQRHLAMEKSLLKEKRRQKAQD